jgi:hypothetical protein
MDWWSVALGGPLLGWCFIALVAGVADGIQMAAERLRTRRDRPEDEDEMSWSDSLLLVGYLAGALAAGDAIVASWCDLPAWRALAAGTGAGVVSASALAWARWPPIGPWSAAAPFFIANAIASWIALS